MVGILGTTAYATESCTEQLWLISTRRAPIHCPPEGAIPLDYWMFGPNTTWSPSDESTFRTGNNQEVPTCVFVHGNRAEWQDAVDAGWMTYWQIKQQAAGRPFRFVIWSWPSERVSHRNRPDAQEKAARSDVQAVYLAQWRNRVCPAVPMSLIGYSFGARIVTGAMHQLSGQASDAPASAVHTPGRLAPVRAILVAAALDEDWLRSGNCHGLALTQLERVLVTVNHCDSALRWYPRLYGRHGPDALGFVGLGAPEWLGPAAANVEQIDVTGEVGRQHAWTSYVNAPSLLARLGWYTFLAPAAPPPTALP